LLLWFIGRKSIDVINLKPAQNLSDLIGMRAKAVLILKMKAPSTSMARNGLPGRKNRSKLDQTFA